MIGGEKTAHTLCLAALTPPALQQGDHAIDRNTYDTSFGFRIHRTSAAREFATSTAVGVEPRYDLINDLMSFGLHRLWKRWLIDAVAPKPGEFLVDLAGGPATSARVWPALTAASPCAIPASP